MKASIKTRSLPRFTLLLLALSMPAQARVSATLSSQTTGMDQPFRLTLEMEGEQSDSPDLSVLDADFDILQRATQQSLSIINGKMSSKRSLILTLLPKHMGKLTIPAISFGDQQTQALSLEVGKPSSQTDVAVKQAWVELSLNKTAAYPEEEVLLTLKLYQAAGVRGESLTPPKPSLSDTRLKLLNESRYTSEKEGTPYRVLERIYGLFAYQSGSLEVEPVGFRGRSGGASVFSLLDDPFRDPLQGSHLIRTQSNPVSIEIKPIPTAFTGDHWLPARNLQLVDTGLDSSQPIVAGKPLTRRIMLVADGLTSSQLPSVTQQVPDGIKPYEERPQLNDTPGRTGFSSSRQSVITLIATQAGRYTLPAIELPWWNTDTDRQEIARLPAVTLEVNPGHTSPATADMAPLSAPTAVTPETDKQSTTDATELGQPDADEGNNLNWLVWLLAAAWLVTLVAWWHSHRRRQADNRPKAETPLADSPAPDHQAAAEIIAGLKQAYARTDAAAARACWLKWAQLRWPENPPNNLPRLARRCNPTLSEAVIALEKALYSPGEETGWALLDPAAINSLQEDPDRPPAQRKGEARLQPLNP
jgi:hypothetical protein